MQPAEQPAKTSDSRQHGKCSLDVCFLLAAAQNPASHVPLKSVCECSTAQMDNSGKMFTNWPQYQLELTICLEPAAPPYTTTSRKRCEKFLPPNRRHHRIPTVNCGVDCTALIRFGMMWEFGTDSRSFCCAGRNLFVAGAFDTDSLFTLWDALVGPVFVFFCARNSGSY